MNLFRTILVATVMSVSVSTSVVAAEKHMFEAEAGEPIDGASKVSDGAASGGSLVGLTSPVKALNSQACRRQQTGNSLRVGLRGDNQRRDKRSAGTQSERSFFGRSTGSFLQAIIICDSCQATSPSAWRRGRPVNVDRILVGDGDLGLPPDIWNLPPLPVAAGPFRADWKANKPDFTPRQSGGATPSSAPGRIGTRSQCRSKATGMRAACIWQKIRSTPSRPRLRSSLGIRLQGHLPQLGD